MADTATCSAEIDNDSNTDSNSVDVQADYRSQPIINELLCYLSDKLDVLPIDTLVKLCDDVYSDTEIQNAKDILYKCCGNLVTNKIRKRSGPNRKVNSLQDICKMLHELEPSDIPCFVARQLSKLPPVSTNHIDVSSLLRELAGVKLQMNDIVSKMDDLNSTQINVQKKLDRLDSKCASPPTNRKTRFLEKSITSVGECASSKDDTELSQSTRINECNVVGDSPFANKSKTVPLSDITNNTAPNEASCVDQSMDKSYAAVLSTEGSHPSRTTLEYAGNDFTTVIRNKPRPNKKHELRGLRTYPPVEIFITRLEPTTTSNDVIQYVKDNSGVNVECKRLDTKYDTYASFWIRVTGKVSNMLLRSSFWPDEVLVRKFYNRRDSDATWSKRRFREGDHYTTNGSTQRYARDHVMLQNDY
ncbi:uncharacterized protein LOC135463368 [Liolophura sinensis]|uniref:uncharacterized protein LOC135463368 n=1 Tax=Liolophura sinensis TaxID=3198878 RepID=UPI003157F3E4